MEDPTTYISVNKKIPDTSSLSFHAKNQTSRQKVTKNAMCKLIKAVE